MPECVGRLGGEGLWVRDYGGEALVGRPFGARRLARKDADLARKGLGPVTLKK